MSTTLKQANLHDAYQGSYYTILGAGGDLTEWVNGYNGLLADKGIGEPVEWLTTTGEAVNDYAEPSDWRNAFQPDLTILLFPLNGLDVGKLAMFKLQMGDRWFDDVVDNM